MWWRIRGVAEDWYEALPKRRGILDGSSLRRTVARLIFIMGNGPMNCGASFLASPLMGMFFVASQTLSSTW